MQCILFLREFWLYHVVSLLKATLPTKARHGHSAISSQGYFSLTARPASTTNWPSKKNFGFRGVSTQGTPSPTLTWQVQFGWSSGLHSFGHLADRKWGLVAVWMNEPASQTTSQWDDLGSWFNLLHHKAPNWAERKLILHSTVMRSLGLKAFTFGIWGNLVPVGHGLLRSIRGNLLQGWSLKVNQGHVDHAWSCTYSWIQPWSNLIWSTINKLSSWLIPAFTMGLIAWSTTRISVTPRFLVTSQSASATVLMDFSVDDTMHTMVRSSVTHHGILVCCAPHCPSRVYGGWHL